MSFYTDEETGYSFRKNNAMAHGKRNEAGNYEIVVYSPQRDELWRKDIGERDFNVAVLVAVELNKDMGPCAKCEPGGFASSCNGCIMNR